MHYSNITAEEYLRQKNIEFKKEGSELKLKCLFNDCDHDSKEDELHLYMDSTTGLYHCKKCNATGNLVTLARHLGDSVNASTESKPVVEKPKFVFNPAMVEIWHKKLSEKNRKYLNDRGITNELIDINQIGENSYFDKKHNENVSFITIPIRDEYGKVIFVKKRRDPESEEGAKYLFYPKGSEAALFGAHNLEHAKSTVFICEGEFDAMVLESQGGIAVSSTAGAGTFKDEWIEKFFAVLELEEIFICYDNDKPGEDGARMVAEKLSRIECLKIYIVSLPKELNGEAEKTDITDYFVRQKGTIEELLAYAQPYAKEEQQKELKEEPMPNVTTNEFQSYECRKDGYTWIFEKRKLQIRRESDKIIVFSDIFRSEYFWHSFENQEKVRKALIKIGVCEDKKQAETLAVEVFSKVRTDWKMESEAEKEAKKQEELTSKLIANRKITLDEVHEAVSKIGIYQKELLDIIIAIIISASPALRTKPPLWLMIVGSPSSIKTELVKLFDLLVKTIILYVDSMTENAFCSGYVSPDGGETNDLLPLLNQKCFIVKDYTTIFSLNEDTLKRILGDLTSIFDESFNKHSATRGSVQYNSLFSQIGCITPSVINKHQRYMNQLGARFLSYRVPELSDEEERVGFEIAWSDCDGISREEIIENARVVASSYCFQLLEKLPSTTLKNESAEIRKKINDLTKFIARARGLADTIESSYKDSKGEVRIGREVVDKQVEHPWRAFRQIRALARCLAIVRGKDEVTLEEIETVTNVAMSSMPVQRAKALAVFKDQREISAKELSEKLEIGMRTSQRILKELFVLKILDKIQYQRGVDLGGFVNSYFPVKEFEDILLAKPTEMVVQVPQISQQGQVSAKTLF